LKQEQGKNILTGGVTIPSQLAELGLIDEYLLWFTDSYREGDGCLKVSTCKRNYN